MKRSPYVPTTHINLDAICGNYRHLRGLLAANGQQAGPSVILPGRDGESLHFTWPDMLPVIKSNAYGHGHIQVAHALMEKENANIFALGHVQEAAELRQGIEEMAKRFGRTPNRSLPLLISLLGPTGPEDVELCEEFGIIPMIHTVEQLPLLEKLKKPLPVAIKCNSGMARLGFAPGDIDRVVERLRALPKVVPVLAVSHLANADTDNGAATIRAQAEIFAGMLASLRQAWPHIAVSLCNSAGLLQVRIASEVIGQHTCRAGLSLYGGNPMHGTALAALGKGLKPAMSVRATVIAVRTLQPGEGTGYGHAFVAMEPMRIGIIAAGYSNYVPRSLSNRGCFCAEGTRVRVLGRVSMEMTAIDLSDVPKVGVGDKVWLLGGPYETAVTPEELADTWGTISYEVFCLLGGNAREYEFSGEM